MLIVDLQDIPFHSLVQFLLRVSYHFLGVSILGHSKQWSKLYGDLHKIQIFNGLSYSEGLAKGVFLQIKQSVGFFFGNCCAKMVHPMLEISDMYQIQPKHSNPPSSEGAENSIIKAFLFNNSGIHFFVPSFNHNPKKCLGVSVCKSRLRCFLHNTLLGSGSGSE